jgi:photosystem II stability/assembly factor-like uncharacterized protein
VTDIRFADTSDGWVFGGSLWATHSGGSEWHQITFAHTLLNVEQLEPGANGYVFAVFEVCATPSTATGCTFRLMRSRADADAWSVISPPGSPAGRPVIGNHGDTVWVMYFQRSTGLEWISHDDGAIWNLGSMPCEPDLGGTFDPVSTSVIWAFCATGNSGAPSVSTTGGVTWSSAGGVGGEFSNAAMVAALSQQQAFVGGRGSGLSLTSNGGNSYASLQQFGSAWWAGFTNAQVGYVIIQDQTTQATQLWRTIDSGNHWSVVSFP